MLVDLSKIGSNSSEILCEIYKRTGAWSRRVSSRIACVNLSSCMVDICEIGPSSVVYRLSP